MGGSTYEEPEKAVADRAAAWIKLRAALRESIRRAGSIDAQFLYRSVEHALAWPQYVALVKEMEAEGCITERNGGMLVWTGPATPPSPPLPHG